MTADWRTMGARDASRGSSVALFSENRSACATFGIAPDMIAYEAGREEGLRRYCTPKNGFARGAAGGVYDVACAKDLEPAFLAALGDGFELFARKRAVITLEEQIEAKRREEDRIRFASNEKQRAMEAKTTDADARQIAVGEIKALWDERSALEQDIARLSAAHAVARAELRRYEAGLSKP